MSIDPFAGVPCSCGGQGCLEVYASATAIVRMAREALCRFPESILPKVDEVSSEDVYRAGLEGDELAREVFRRMGVFLGIGLANLVNLLNPEMIVIAGGVVNGWDLFAKDMQQQVVQRAFPIPAAEVKIVPADCGDDAGLMGAARLGFDFVRR
jgi:glucokinase